MKERFFKWLVSIFFGKDTTFTIVRKGYLEELAREVTRHPNSKITALRILRLDGTSFKDAMTQYERIISG